MNEAGRLAPYCPAMERARIIGRPNSPPKREPIAAAGRAESQKTGDARGAKGASFFRGEAPKGLFRRVAPGGKLQLRKARIEPAARQQLAMRSLIDDDAIVEDDDAVGFQDRREAVRDDDRRSPS